MKNKFNKIQIGVMGSAADLNYSKKLEEMAEAVGAAVAQSGATLMFGAERDYDSLSTAAARGAKKNGGLVIGVTYNKGFSGQLEPLADAIIVTGLERGGGRELVLVQSCHGIITVGGGSGTLTEMAIAYQANIPIVALTGTGGWSEKLANQYLDERRRVKVQTAKNATEAVKKILTTISKTAK